MDHKRISLLTYFFGDRLIYGDTVLSTKDPNPRRKFLVIEDISKAEKKKKKVVE